MTRKTQSNDNIRRLEIAHNIREFHHKSLWEEEKHFTWLVSIVLSSQVFIYTSTLCNQSKLAFILVGSSIGVFLCITAFRVLRREGEYFHIALSKFVEEYNTVFTTSPLPVVSKIANKDIQKLIKIFFSGKIGVRDSFQIIFLFLY